MNNYSDEQWVNWIDQLAEKNYIVIDDFISPTLFHVLIVFFFKKLNQDLFVKAGIGSIRDYRIKSVKRGDYIYWLEPGRDIDLLEFYKLADLLKEKLNRYAFLSLSGYEFHFAHYPKGSHYEKHLDQFKDRNNRLITFILYLNKNWNKGDGGELVIYDGVQNQTVVEPVARRCVIFRSNILEHEVLYTKTDRYSLTGWLLYQPPTLGYILG